MLGLSDWVNANGDLVLGVLGILVAGGFLLLRMKSTRGPIIRGFRRLPGIAGIVEMRRAAFICRGLGTLLGNGVTLSDALKVMTETGGADADALAAVQERVRRGGRLVDALGGSALVPPLAARMLRVGEESGSSRRLPVAPRTSTKPSSASVSTGSRRSSGRPRSSSSASSSAG